MSASNVYDNAAVGTNTRGSGIFVGGSGSQTGTIQNSIVADNTDTLFHSQIHEEGLQRHHVSEQHVDSGAPVLWMRGWRPRVGQQHERSAVRTFPGRSRRRNIVHARLERGEGHECDHRGLAGVESGDRIGGRHAVGFDELQPHGIDAQWPRRAADGERHGRSATERAEPCG